MVNPNNATLLSASTDMRQYLGETMVSDIRRNAKTITQENMDNYNIIDQTVKKIPLLIDNINDPTDTDINIGIIIGGFVNIHEQAKKRTSV